MNIPKSKNTVTVCMISYKNEQFIKQAIDSIFMQKVNFDYDLVISNDCSPDGTDKIIQDYIKNHPKGNKIKYYLQEKNLGHFGNWSFIINKCQGDYVAILESDDYWTDENKLQLQYDFLENNKDYSTVFHDCTVQNDKENTSYPLRMLAKSNPVLDKHIIGEGGNLCATCSLFFRNYFKEYPAEVRIAKSIERGLTYFLMTRGKFWYIDKKMCVYRVHGGGVTSAGVKTRIEYMKSNIELLQFFQTFTNYKYSKLVKNEISKMSKNILHFSISDENHEYFKFLNFPDLVKVRLRKLLK